MESFIKNVRWLGLCLLRALVALFLVELVALTTDGVGRAFGCIEIGSAVLLASFVSFFVLSAGFVPVALLAAYGAGKSELSSSAEELFGRALTALRTRNLESRRRFIGLSLASVLGILALMAAAHAPVIEIIARIQTPLFASLLVMAVTLAALIVSLLAWPVWRRTGMLAARLFSKPPAPWFALALVFALALAGFGALVSFKWNDLGAYLPWRSIVVTVALAAVFFGLAAVERRLTVALKRKLTRGLSASALAVFVSGGALFALLPLSLERAPYLVEDADGPVAFSYSLVTRALDEDGDGYLPWLAQGDCMPSNGRINPGALDEPNDGIDQDCDGKDSRASTKIRRGRHDYPARPRPRPMPVIFITIDAVAALHMELYGAARKTMPFLTRKAKSAVVFNHAFSEGPATRLSFPSLLSGLHNTQIRRELKNKTTVPWINVKNTMASVFSKGGYRTEAVSPDSYFAYQMSWLYKGFDLVDKSAVVGACGRHKNGRKVTEAALKRLDHLSKLDKFFLWVHYTDAHPPHHLPDGVKPIFGKEQRDIYDRELRLLDDALRPLFKGIEERLGKRDHIIALTADHGHAFDPKHEKWHQDHDVSTAVTWIPMMFFSPYGKGKRSDQLAQGIDVMPTLLNMVGLKAKGLSGESLLPAIQGRPDLGRPIMQQFYLHERRLEGLDPLVELSIRKGRHVLRQRRGRKARVYDFKSDPFEENDLASSRPDLLEELGGIRDGMLKWAYEKWNRKME